MSTGAAREIIYDAARTSRPLSQNASTNDCHRCFVCNLITLASASQLLHNYCLIKQNDLILYVCAECDRTRLPVIYSHFSVAPNNNMQAHARIYLVAVALCARELGRWLCIVCVWSGWGSVFWQKLWPRRIHTLSARSARHCCEVIVAAITGNWLYSEIFMPAHVLTGVHQAASGLKSAALNKPFLTSSISHSEIFSPLQHTRNEIS